MRRLALAAIRLYQRHLSPRKGFCCAYRVHTGRQSCSTLGYRAIRRFGIWRGLLLLRQRLGQCSMMFQRHRQQCHHVPALAHGQAGFCDPGCSFDCGFMACDFVSNAGGMSGCLNIAHGSSCSGCADASNCTSCATCGNC